MLIISDWFESLLNLFCFFYLNFFYRITNLDTSVTSLHSSGRDSGLDMSREQSESPSRQGQRWSKERELTNRTKCICGHNNSSSINNINSNNNNNNTSSSSSNNLSNNNNTNSTSNVSKKPGGGAGNGDESRL